MSYIKEIYIENFKCFNGAFRLKLKPGCNILVGDNDAGKSSILEAINLALTGFFHGRYLKTDLSQYLFNNKVVENFLTSLSSGKNPPLPHILIELYFTEDGHPQFIGDKNTLKQKECGLGFKISFDEKYNQEYKDLIQRGELKTIPIEYYDISCYSFAREAVTTRSIPIKSAFIDSSNNRLAYGSDIYVNRIVKDLMDSSELVGVSQAFRVARENFSENTSIKQINSKIKKASRLSEKEIKIDIDLPTKNAWESAIVTYVDNVPFHFIGKGEQSIIKTKLALAHDKTQEANIILLEEPENHLSHSNLNKLLKDITAKENSKQFLITTHSSYVANKLGLENLIFLNQQKTFSLADLDSSTKIFFKKVAGYDTLRLLLSKKTILIEGDSDELIVQRAYMDNHDGHRPIEDGIDVVSVGTSFLRFLEIANKIGISTTVVTDNDGNLSALEKKYCDYLGSNSKENIKICYDPIVVTGTMKNFNYNTLEPTLLRANSLKKLNEIFATSYECEDDLLKYMHDNKTECALAIFEALQHIEYPEYIKKAIN